jgi:glycosyltransferase involved in cell wall biosynthesis
LKVLVVTNLFGYPWDRSRGMFNQQQFDRLARRVELSVLVAVPWTDAIRRPAAYWSARRDARKRWPYVDYFVFWYLPGTAQALHALFFFLSLALQRPVTVFFRRWHTLIGSWGFPDAVATAALGRITSTPVLMKVHGTDVNDYLHTPGKRWQILAAARHCRAVMSVSGALRDQLVDAGVEPSRVEVVYNGVDAAAFHPMDRVAARARLGVVGDGQMLLFVGNLKFTKGCLELLEAFVDIAATHDRLSLVFVGDGEARAPMLRRVAECGLAAQVRFLGKIEHATLPDWFAAADLLCLPSYNEGVPNVVLEAMACGVPVVATRVGGIPEVLPEFAGVLVAPRDATCLAFALRSALARKWDAQRIAAHARQFSWEANINRVMALVGPLQPREAGSPGLP